MQIVFENQSKTSAEVALLKVEAHLDYHAVFGGKPQAEQRVFAVVCNRGQRKKPGGHLILTAGEIQKVLSDPAGSSIDLVYTDIPGTQGDSGGPLLSSNGQLVGVLNSIESKVLEFNGFGFDWPVYLRSQNVYFFPNKQFIQEIIAEDRVEHPATN